MEQPTKDPRMSHQTLRILQLIAEGPKEGLAGSDISKRTRMLSGTVYPILMRLERVRWLASELEQVEPSKVGRPRRRLYRLTGLGYNKANAALSELGVFEGRLAWNT
jgi:PadR family transcriptional regulator, regulatory protein PadR